MIDRMNRTMVAETPEEKEMASLLNRANNSEMLENYAEALKQELQKNINISFYSYRVKKVHSAIRSFRIAKFQKLEQMHDLFGVLVVVDNEEEIKRVVQIIRNKFEKEREEFSEYNLLTEKDWTEQRMERRNSFANRDNEESDILANLKKIMAHTENLEKVLPPLSYIITSHIQIENEKIPVEFRIQTKNGFHVLESFYFVVYKNDTLDPKMKGPLLFLIQQILNRKVRLDTDKSLIEQEKNELWKQIGFLYQYHFNVLCQNRDLLAEVWREYEKIAVKYKLQLPVFDFHFFGVGEKSKEIMDLVDQELDDVFENYKNFDIRLIDTAKYMEEAEGRLSINILVHNVI